MKFQAAGTCLAIAATFGTCAAITFAQPIDPAAITDEDLQDLNDQRIAVTHWTASPASLMAALLTNYDLVVDGYFDSVPSTEEANAGRGDGPVQISARFVVEQVLKGSDQDLEFVDVLIAADMFDFAGDGKAQFKTKQARVDAQLVEYRELEKNIAALNAAHDAGEVEEGQFEMAELNAARSAILMSGITTQHRQLPLHGEHFYTLGGALRAGERYLLGLDPNSSSAYELMEFPGEGRNIFWGETRMRMLEGRGKDLSP